MAQIFISYVNSERDKVSKIANGLERAGFSVWWDHALIGGQDYTKVIDQEIAAAKVVLPIWSDASVQSRWVAAEAARGSEKLFPVRITGAEPPLPYNQLQTLDLRHWNGDESDPRWMRLVTDLHTVIGGQASVHVPTPQSRGRRRTVGIAAWAAAGLVLSGVALVSYNSLRTSSSGSAPLDASARALTPAQEGNEASAVASTTATTRVEPRLNAGRGIHSYSDALQALRETGGQIQLQICTAPAQCGSNAVRVGQIITVRVTSQVSGRLILLDEDASGAQSQIFPNGLSPSAENLVIAAGQTVELPQPGQGFVFGVSPPIGRSRLVAVVYPETAPLPAIVAENSHTRGIEPIPQSRRDDFAAATANALSGQADGSSAVAIGEVSYSVAPQ